MDLLLKPRRSRLRTSWAEGAVLRLGWRRGRPPTDFELLRAIYERHDDDFEANSAHRETRVLQPIEIPEIADQLEQTPDMIFGRLYHDLDRRYGEPYQPGRPRKSFFALKAGSQANCVNWPLMVGVLAGMWEERRRRYLTTGLSAVSIAIAIASLILSIRA